MAEHRYFDDESGGDQDDGQYDAQDEGDDEDARRLPAWLPPTADHDGHERFGSDFDRHFHIPGRLATKSIKLVEAANDFHFAMLNDIPRNEFYRDALLAAIVPGESVVLEIGTGSGLLAMLSAKAGAKHVYAIEASAHLARGAEGSIKRNGLSDKITVINKMSTDVRLGEDIPEKCDVCVSEILGTLLLGENALEYVDDVRRRLLKGGARIIPASGKQYISLIESPQLASVTAVSNWGGIDLREFNELQDTVSVVFTKQYGFRFSSIEHKVIVPRICVGEVNFMADSPGCFPNEHKMLLQAQHSGIIHAAVAYWEAYAGEDEDLVMSTDPDATTDNFPRDMQWGQAIQLLEDLTNGESQLPQPLHVEKGDWIELTTRSSYDDTVMQFLVAKATSAPGSATPMST